MADKKISGLNPATLPLAGTEEIAIVQGGETKRVASNQLAREAATQTEVNTGTNLTKFVNPSTFTNASKWNEKVDIGKADNINSYTSNFVFNMNREFSNQNIVVLTDSTGNDVGEWGYLTMQHLASTWLTHTVRYALWNISTLVYNTPVTYQTGTSLTPKVLTVYLGGASGQGIVYFKNNLTNLFPVNIDLCFLSAGHNESYGTSILFRLAYFSLTKLITDTYRDCSLICIAQNPKASTATYYLNGISNGIDIGKMCAKEGYGFINVMQRFFDYGNYAVTLMQDDTHPNALGSALWSQTVCESLIKKNYSSPNVFQGKSQHLFANVNGYYNPLNNISATIYNDVPIPFIPLPDNSDNSISSTIQIPSWWRVISIYILWKTPTDSTNTKVDLVSRLYSIDEQSSLPVLINSGFIQPNGSTANRVIKSQIFSQSGSSELELIKPYKPMTFSVRRRGTQANDTYTGNAEILGVYFERKL